MKAIRVVGCILAALQFLISVFLVYMLYVTKLVPFKIMVIVAVVLALLPIIVVIMMKGKRNASIGNNEWSPLLWYIFYRFNQQSS